jgi:hypothetical protein
MLDSLEALGCTGMFTPADGYIMLHLDNLVMQRLDDLGRGFRECVERFNAAPPAPPFGGVPLENHRDTLRLVDGFPRASDAARDGGFAYQLSKTLRSWGIGEERHKAALVQELVFSEQLRRISSDVAQLEQLRIDALDDERGVASLI